MDDWTQDKFGNHTDSSQRYFTYRKDNLLELSPIENETVEGYTRRIANLIQKWERVNTEAHIYGRKMWHSHKNPSGCWLCDGITMLWILYETYNLVCNQLPQQGKLHTFHLNGKTLSITPPKKL